MGRWHGGSAFPLKILTVTEAVTYGRAESYHAGPKEGKECPECSGGEVRADRVELLERAYGYFRQYYRLRAG
jgi:hypothetical protein